MSSRTNGILEYDGATMRLVIWSVCMGLLIVGMSCYAEQQPVSADAAIDERGAETLLEALENTGEHKILQSALRDLPEIRALLAKGEKKTFFAPTDKAFERVPDLADLLKDEIKLAGVLKRHLIMNEELSVADIRRRKQLAPFAGKVIKVDADDDSTSLNDAKITMPDRYTANGVFHGIDHVLMKNNDSILREAGKAVEGGLKTGAEKIEDAFTDD